MPIPKALMTLAVPTIISQIINLIYNMVDTLFIGMTGDSYKIAGVTVAFTIFMLTIGLSNVFGIGGGSLISRLMGRGKSEEARNVAAFSIYGSIGISLLYSLLTFIFMDPLLRLLGASDETIRYGAQYLLWVVVFGGLPVILSAVLAHLLRNVGQAKQASAGLSFGGVLNIILDPLFMFVLLPKGMEVTGAALATMISNVIACLYLLFMVARASQTEPLSLSPARLSRVRGHDLSELFSVGIPSGLLSGLFDLANIVANKLMSGHGDLALAALGIVMKAERVPNAINIGLCQGMLPLVAYNFASGNHDRMNAAIKTTRRYGLIVAFTSVFLFIFLSKPVVNLFLNTDGEGAAVALTTVALAAGFLRLRSLASPFQFLNFHASFSLQAMGAGRETMLHAIVRELVFYIPTMFLMNHLFHAQGLAVSLVIGEALGALFVLILLEHWIKKHHMHSGAAI